MTQQGNPHRRRPTALTFEDLRARTRARDGGGALNRIGGRPLFDAIRGVELVLGLEPGELYDDLSARAQDEVWADLRARQDHLNGFLAYGDEPRKPRKPGMRRRAPGCAPRRTHTERDVLREIPLRDAFEVMVGEPVPAGGMVRCPLPDHEDRTPSCHVGAELFHCFGCGAGGSLIDLSAGLFGLEPRGASYFDLRRRIALLLLGREEAA